MFTDCYIAFQFCVVINAIFFCFYYYACVWLKNGEIFILFILSSTEKNSTNVLVTFFQILTWLTYKAYPI